MNSLSLLRAKLLVTALSFVGLSNAQAQTQSPVIGDANGDGVVRVVGFGDSITFGIGDGLRPGQFIETIPSAEDVGGYPKRLEQLLGVSVVNRGVPGEELVATGVLRIPQEASEFRSDYFLLLEGSNDAVKQVSREDYARALQRSINVARALGRVVVPMTPPPPTATHESLLPFTNTYAQVVRELAAVNGLQYVDLERTFTTVCPVLDECPLYNLPEGLHPNTMGYDAIAESVAAVLLGIDIFSPTGPSTLEAALGLPEGSVIVRAP